MIRGQQVGKKRTRGSNDWWFQKCEAAMCEKVQAVVPLPTSPLSLGVRALGEKVLEGIQLLCFLRQITDADQHVWAQAMC